MKTEIKTSGYGGGFTDARSYAATRSATPLVQVRYRQGSCLGFETKDARPKRQLRTGKSNCTPQLTDDSISRMPRWKRWGSYALAAGTLTGIIPLAAAELISNALNGALMSLESAIGSGAMAALGIGACIIAIIAGMAYLFRLVER